MTTSPNSKSTGFNGQPAALRALLCWIPEFRCSNSIKHVFDSKPFPQQNKEKLRLELHLAPNPTLDNPSPTFPRLTCHTRQAGSRS